MEEKRITAEEFDRAVPEVSAQMTIDAIMNGQLDGKMSSIIGMVGIMFAAELKKALFGEYMENEEAE